MQEGTAGTSLDPKFDSIELEPQRFSSCLTIGNSLLRNQAQLGKWLETSFRAEKSQAKELLFLQGTGGPQPLGLINSPCKISVTRDSANTITRADIAAMARQQHNLAGAIWIASRRRQFCGRDNRLASQRAGSSGIIATYHSDGLPVSLMKTFSPGATVIPSERLVASRGFRAALGNTGPVRPFMVAPAGFADRYRT